MLTEMAYNRENAVLYAKMWALGRNPKYLDYDKLGGDCTNFASQCVFAGTGIMNYTYNTGWYYNNGNDKSPAWTGVEYFYNFLTRNKGVGPFGEEIGEDELELGDIVQFGNESNHFYHSPVVTGITNGDILVCAHSFDAYMRPISTYEYDRVRYIHILGFRK